MDGPAQVSARGQGVPVLQCQVHPGRSENVAGVFQAQVGVLVDLGDCPRFDRLEQVQRAVDVHLVVQRLRGVVLAVAASVGVLGLLRLQPCAVPQDHLGEPGRVRTAHHRAPEAVPHQARQVAAVVEVRVGEQDGMHRRGVRREGPPVPAPEFGKPLEEPAVHQ
ncbi:hypothetical protein GCM10009863_01250 [Streptomyces axinellae]|uniref:Uncharacterized protein n=1 Tax=Streptomyces axinellae TaxID=552788 RepID=A0ABP6BYU1_9ACTN